MEACIYQGGKDICSIRTDTRFSKAALGALSGAKGKSSICREFRTA
jgi:hypothetical protein